MVDREKMMTQAKPRLRAVAFVAAVCLLSGIVLALAHHHRQASMRTACLNNLLMINEVLNCCFPMERGLQPGEQIDPKELILYFQGKVIPKCPSGAAYEIPFVAGGHPKC